MITAISSFNGNTSKVNLTNQNQTAPIAFTGNPVELGKGLLKNESKLGGKITKFVKESTEFVRESFKKTTIKNELPITKKPVLAAGESDWATNSKNLLNTLSNKGIFNGTVLADESGGIMESYKPGIKTAIDKAVKAGKIDSTEGESLKSQLSFCGDDGDGLDGIVDNHGDDIADIIFDGIEKILDFFGG